MTTTEWFWLAMVFIPLIPFYYLARILSRAVESHRRYFLIMAAVVAVHVTVIIAIPMRQLRIASDTELLSHAPFKVEGFGKRNPKSGIVDLKITNAKGDYMYLDIYRETRKVRFSGVRVPDSIQF